MSRTSFFTWDRVATLVKYPHLIGHLCGFKDMTEVHSGWIKYVHDNRQDCALMASRSSFKSTAMVIVGVIYRLMRDKNETICIMRKSYSNAAEVLRTIMNLCESPIIHELLTFCWFATKDSRIPDKAEWRFNIRKEGRINLSVRTSCSPEPTVMAVGIDSNLTGVHVDVLIADDVVTLQDRLYQSERDYTKLVMAEARGNIVKKTGYSIIIGTPYQREDYWSVLEAEGINIPKYPYQMLPFIKEEEIEKARSVMSPAYFACNYELSYKNESDQIFFDPHMGRWNKAHNKRVCAHIDASYSGTDTTALTIAAEMPDGKVNMVGFVWHEHIKDIIPKIFMRLQQYDAHTVYSEQNSDKGYTLHMLEEHPLAKTIMIYPELYNESMHKQLKIASVLKDKWDSIIFAEETDDEYLLQITDWSEDTKYLDDCPDSAASILLHGGFSIGGDWMALYN